MFVKLLGFSKPRYSDYDFDKNITDTHLVTLQPNYHIFETDSLNELRQYMVIFNLIKSIK